MTEVYEIVHGLEKVDKGWVESALGRRAWEHLNTPPQVL